MLDLTLQLTECTNVFNQAQAKVQYGTTLGEKAAKEKMDADQAAIDAARELAEAVAAKEKADALAGMYAADDTKSKKEVADGQQAMGLSDEAKDLYRGAMAMDKYGLTTEAMAAKGKGDELLQQGKVLVGAVP